MSKALKYTICIVACVALMAGLYALAWYLGEKRGRQNQYAEDMETFKPDTTFIYDTAWFDRPVPVVTEVVDTFLQEVVDTIQLRDTVFIALPIERKIYEDSLYRAIVSGYKPSLDKIEVFQTTKVVTVNVPVKMKPHNAIYLDITAQYDAMFRIPIIVGYERMWDSGFHIGAGVGYEPMVKKPVFQIKGGYSFQW